MRQEKARIIENKKIAKDVYKMVLEAELASLCRPGQFIEISVPGYFLRRPISICEIEEESLTIIYKVVGAGTNVMSGMEAGERLDIFGPCGNGFPEVDEPSLILFGGGVGVPPLYELAKHNKNKTLYVVLGFNSMEDVFYADEFRALGAKVFIATMDGSCGTKGTVLDAAETHGVRTGLVMACGPLPMLRALDEAYDQGYLSLEARMACGIGACMGCVVEMKDGSMKRVCKDGPVFEIGSVKL